ncbi:GNAT family N-acetyltransferase [Aliikangiella sp. IMCC44359]|uniref:GNAT family N-acetyltransferase n=1 Tax=Aliikangiella sp. IMCC44359 TaxID=3459125 RepID=UPI00403AD59A
MMKIKKATEKELSAIASMLIETQQAHVQAYPKRYVIISLADAINLLHKQLDQNMFWVAIENNEVVGYIIAEHIKTQGNKILKAREYCYLQQIGVTKTSQDQGIGKKLIEHLIVECLKHGLKDIELDVWAFNNNAQQFFKQCHFEPYASKLRLTL